MTKTLSSDSGNKKAVPSSELKIGDRVIFVKNDVAEYYINESNPLIGTEYECEGVVEGVKEDRYSQPYFIHVLWDNGSRNKYDNYTLAKVGSETEAKPKKEGIMVKFDFASFAKGEFGVRCNTEVQAREFFKILEANKVVWADDSVCNQNNLCYYESSGFYNYSVDCKGLRYKKCSGLMYKDFSSFTPTASSEKDETVGVTFDLSLFNSGNAMRCKNVEQETAFLKYLGKKGIRRKNGEICSPDRKDKYCGNNMYYALDLEGLDYVLIHGDATVNPRKRKILPYEHFVDSGKPAYTEIAEDALAEIVEFDLSKFTENLGIHCKTEEQARIFFKWLNSINAVWRAGELCEPTRNNYSIYKDRTVYFIELIEDRKEVCFDSINFSYKRHKPYEYFLEEVTELKTPDDLKYSVEDPNIQFDLSKFTHNVGIHCKTEEQAYTFFKWLVSLGTVWLETGHPCHPLSTGCGRYKENTVYFLSSNQWGSLTKRTVTCKSLLDVQSHFGEYYSYEHFLENKDTKTTTRKEQPMKASTIAVKGKENVKKAATTSKSAILQAQEGAALLAAVKAGLNKGPLPVKMKEVLNTPAYGDFIVGLLLDVIVPTVTSSKKAAEVTQAANIVASTNLSGQFTWLQDLMRTVVEKTVPDMSFSKDK